jgi:parvulin-like peptidyl-prolyl isomerase
MQKLADVANEVAVAMTEKDAKLEEVAKKFGVEVKEAPPFPLDAPPEELDKSDEVARTTFERLSKDEPNSDVVLTENGYYVLQLADVIPARPLTFEEAKPKLTEQLTQERSQEAMNLKAAEFRTKIDAELKAGKTFADAAAAAGATAEKLPPFSMAEPAKLDSPDARIIMGRSLDLAEGQLSEPTPSPGGMILVHVDKRLPVDEAKFEQEKTVIAESVLRSKRDAAFAQWLKERRTAANIVTAHSDVTAEG